MAAMVDEVPQSGVPATEAPRRQLNVQPRGDVRNRNMDSYNNTHICALRFDLPTRLRGLPHATSFVENFLVPFI
jgi:hypothetical protein